MQKIVFILIYVIMSLSFILVLFFVHINLFIFVTFNLYLFPCYICDTFNCNKRVLEISLVNVSFIKLSRYITILMDEICEWLKHALYVESYN